MITPVLATRGFESSSWAGTTFILDNDYSNLFL